MSLLMIVPLQLKPLLYKKTSIGGAKSCGTGFNSKPTHIFVFQMSVYKGLSFSLGLSQL